MKTTAIIQARLGSTRFPRKVLQPIWNGLCSIDIILERLGKLIPNYIDNIVLATTTNPIDDELEEEYGGKINVFRGSEEDIFDRITQAAKIYAGGNLIEITGDCPLICFKQLKLALRYFADDKLHYLSNAIIRNFPIGFDWQIYKQWMLTFLNNRIPNENHKIHGGWNLVNYSEILFNIWSCLRYRHWYAPKELFFPEWRVTLDYPEDLEVIKIIVNHFENLDFTLEDVIDFLKKNPTILDINRNCKQKTPGIDKIKRELTDEELKKEYNKEVEI